MPKLWRWFLVLLLGAGYSLFWVLDGLQLNLELGTQQLTANAQSHAGVLGIFAGFIAAIVVIVLTRDASGSTEESGEVIRLSAVGTFLCAFLHAILGSFHYASYAGFSDYWQSLPLDRAEALDRLLFPNYIFNILGLEYLLAVYLCFFGIILVIQYLTNRKELVVLSQFMLLVVYLLGSAWVFLDFASGHLKTAEPFNFKVLGLFYIGLVTLAAAWPLRFPRLSLNSILKLLYLTLALSIVAAIISGIWYALICYRMPSEITAQMVNRWAVSTVTCISIAGGALFALLTFCLNRLTHLATTCEQPISPGQQTDAHGQSIPV